MISEGKTNKEIDMYHMCRVPDLPITKHVLTPIMLLPVAPTTPPGGKSQSKINQVPRLNPVKIVFSVTMTQA